MRKFEHQGEQVAWMRCFERAVASGKDDKQAAAIADGYLTEVSDRIPDLGKEEAKRVMTLGDTKH